MNPLHFTIGLIVCLGVLGGVLELIRRRLLSERYSLLWLTSAVVVLLLLAFYESVYMKIVDALYIKSPPTLLFVVSFFFLALIVLHYSLAITRLSERSKRLAQRIAMLEERLAEKPTVEKDES